jgi:acyl-CoA dehydrogenase
MRDRLDVAPASGLAEATEIVAACERIASEIVGPLADEIDRDARFPHEAIDALRAAGVLSALVPRSLDGPDYALADVARSVTAISRRCASTGMIVAMHHIQVACIARHGRSEWAQCYLREIAAEQLLLASATTEVGIGGDTRSSTCAVERVGSRFTLAKEAPTISYGEYADGVLVTARAGADSPASDQVLVVVVPPELELTRNAPWNALGFRATCSHSYSLRGSGHVDQILSDPFMTISSHTMLPTSHVLWASVWLGLAMSVVDMARAYVRAEARRRPGTVPPGAIRCAELMGVFEQFRALVDRGLSRYETALQNGETLDSLGFAIEMNALKTSTSTLVVDVVNRAMLICGISGYREDSPYFLGRHLRDAHGAALMLNNDRILGVSAQMLLVHKGES